MRLLSLAVRAITGAISVLLQAPKVVNSGLTADWHDWAGDHPTPQLGDFAVLKVKEVSEEPAVSLGGVFDESWKVR